VLGQAARGQKIGHAADSSGRIHAAA
jgi:hypothetical protein